MDAQSFDVTLDVELHQRALRAAEADGVSFSEYVADLIRRDTRRRAGRKYREWMDNLPPDEKAALDHWNQVSVDNMHRYFDEHESA